LTNGSTSVEGDKVANIEKLHTMYRNGSLHRISATVFSIEQSGSIAFHGFETSPVSPEQETALKQWMGRTLKRRRKEQSREVEKCFLQQIQKS